MDLIFLAAVLVIFILMVVVLNLEKKDWDQWKAKAAKDWEEWKNGYSDNEKSDRQ